MSGGSLNTSQAQSSSRTHTPYPYQVISQLPALHGTFPGHLSMARREPEQADAHNALSLERELERKG